MEAKRLLKNVKVLFISLVDKGANRKKIVWKSKDKTEPLFQREIPIKKLDEDKRIVYGIVYAPDEVDTEGDTMTADEIEKMAYGFMEARRTDQVDRQHDYEADEGFVAESWIIKDKDSLFPLEKTGAWAVGIKVTNSGTWDLIKSGDIAGLSMGGFANAEELAKGSWENFKETFLKKANALIENLNSIISLTNSGEIQMSKEEKPVTPEKEPEEKPVTPEEQPEEKPEETPAEKSAEGILEEKLNELLDKIGALEERLEKVEKAHPGRQSVSGRDQKKEEGKGYKGLQIL